MNHQRLNLRSWMLVALTGLVVTGAVGAQQEPSVVTVCPQPSEGCRYTNVQEAVNAAKPGDIVQIAPGVYETKDQQGFDDTISITITKGLTLRGMGTKPEDVVLKANKQVPVIRIEKAQNVTIENLTVREGNGGDGGTHPNSPFPLPGELLGGGLHMKENVSVTLRNVIVTDNLRYGLIAINVHDLTIEGSRFLRTDQSPGRRGGSGIYLERSSAIFNKIVVAESYNPGIEAYSVTLEIHDSQLLTSRAYGGLSAHSLGDTASVVTVERTVIDGNARYGVFISGQAILHMTDSKILNTNPRGEASYAGDNPYAGTGLVVLQQAQSRLERVVFDGNRGEGILVRGTGTLVMTSSTIMNTKDHAPPGSAIPRGPCNLGRTNSLGLCVAEQAQAVVEQSVISSNKIGVWVFEDGRLTLKSSTITKSSSFGIGLGSNRYRNENTYLETLENTIQENGCGVNVVDIDPGIKIVGSGNEGGQANGAPDSCGAVEKIPPGFWK